MSGPLRLIPGDGEALPAVPRPRPRTPTRPSWAEDPIDELAERMVEQVASAVHPYEVAALLESDGLTNEQMTRRYDRPDLFTLAEDLYARVPRHYPQPASTPDPWRPDTVRCALRGVVFALPGLAYVLGAGLWQGAADITGLVVSGLAAWAWNQALSHRAHLRLATEGGAAAARTLAVGAPAGALGAAGIGLLVCGPDTGAAFAAGQSCYLAAASVLLVLGRERALLAALLPVAAGGAVCWLQRPPDVLAVVLLLSTVTLTAGVAAHAVRALLRSGPAAPKGTGPPRLRSLPYGLFGLAAGVLAALAGLAEPLSVVVLTLSMGCAEWLLYHFRSLSLAALRAAGTLRRYVLLEVRALVLCLGSYLALLAAGALSVGVRPAPLLGLGAVLWTALLLQAFSLAWLPALVSLATAATEAGAALAGLPPDPVALAGRTAAALVLAAAAARLLTRPTAHR
ncbi:hypothetical protein OHS70_02865 [Streptomyces sp. NBC_00390]|uniref:hypothetical protein n=1 Tax=Streptomyces sp. NBC_00390 TaxID=2975736 RepID=UPI002E1A6E88